MTTSNIKRLYSVEFFRVWAILFIFFRHIGLHYPENVGSISQNIFGTTQNNWWMGVEYFFIIGGFFLYKRVSYNESPYNLIRKTWLRLMPGFLFAYIVCILFANVGILHLPAILLFLGGTAMHINVLTGGDWFVGAYFWVSCLIICLFCAMPRKIAFLILGVLIYLSITLKTNASPLNRGGFLDTYYTFVGVGIDRGIYCMGLGMTAAFISQKILFSTHWLSRAIGTLAEVFCISSILCYHSMPHIPSQSYTCAVISMAFLTISCEHSWGLISEVLNKLPFIHRISRYVFPSLMGHIAITKVMNMNSYWNLDFFTATNLVLIGSIVLGIIEYHLVEHALVSRIRKFILYK